MIKISIEDLEAKLDRGFKKNYLSLGVDTASRAGWAIVRTDDKDAHIEYGTVNVDSDDLFFKYDKIFEFFYDLVEKKIGPDNKNAIIVIEDTFFGQNVKTLKMLIRVGMLVYLAGFLHGIKRYFILPSASRATLGFKGNLKKSYVQQEFLKKTGIEMKGEDEIDGLILALNGLLLKEEKVV